MTLANHVKTVGAAHMYPEDEVWDYHCGSSQGLFRNLRFFSPALNARMGPSDTAKEYFYKSQVTTSHLFSYFPLRIVYHLLLVFSLLIFLIITIIFQTKCH